MGEVIYEYEMDWEKPNWYEEFDKDLRDLLGSNISKQQEKELADIVRDIEEDIENE